MRQSGRRCSYLPECTLPCHDHHPASVATRTHTARSTRLATPRRNATSYNAAGLHVVTAHTFTGPATRLATPWCNILRRSRPAHGHCAHIPKTCCTCNVGSHSPLASTYGHGSTPYTAVAHCRAPAHHPISFRVPGPATRISATVAAKCRGYCSIENAPCALARADTANGSSAQPNARARVPK